MMGLSGPLTRVDMRRAPFRLEEVCPDSGVPGPSAKGGLYGALFTGLTRVLTANPLARHSQARARRPRQYRHASREVREKWEAQRALQGEPHAHRGQNRPRARSARPQDAG